MGLRLFAPRKLFVLIFFPIGPSLGYALDNGQAKTPPMGWNSWNKFACKGCEREGGARGSRCYGRERHEGRGLSVRRDRRLLAGRPRLAGNIVADPENFPSGIKALADYVHSKGLKFGIYTDAGTKTCAKPPRQHRPRVSGCEAVCRPGALIT